MDQELRKVAHDTSAVVQAAAAHMRKIANDNTALVRENTELSHELCCHKLARRMEERGLQSDLNYDEKVAVLLRTPTEKIANMEQAIELAAGGFTLGAATQVEKTSGHVDTRDDLDSFISSQAAYG